jgi:hypothetical protein
VGKKLSAEVERLFSTAVQVDGHAEGVLTGHAQADGRIESAEAGLRGLSARALTTKTTAWRQTSVILGSAVAGHAEALRASGFGFSDMEERNAAALSDVAPKPGAQ